MSILSRSALRALVGAMLALLANHGMAHAQRAATARDTSWKDGGVCYEIFVRSFKDSDGDGIGDIRGLIQKLDHVNDGVPGSGRSLGARCIWLMPIAASPSYHGYDVKNYYRVNPEYGTNADFKRLVAEAHRRGIRVLVDLVLNHASSEHPYFKRALQDTASPYRTWFTFSATNPNVRGPWGQQVWHKSPVRDEYYYGIFTAEMPDLNYGNPAVREEAARVGRFWLTEMGVDGFRLDAVSYLVESGGKLSHTSGTHDVLRDFGTMVRRTAPGAFTIGEVWDTTGTVLPYYPDQLDAYFAFEPSDAILTAVRTGSAKGLLAPFLRMQAAVPSSRWSPFQRNHDQTRTVTALEGSMARARLSAALLLTLPGLPFVYYGEEIGMSGDKPDPRLRTPMQWTGGRAAGFTTGEAWEPLQGDSLTANVAAQHADPASLLNLYRRLIQLRSSNAALASGELVAVASSSDAVAAYARRAGASVVVVVSNLGASPLAGVTLSSARLLAPGRYPVTELLGRGRGATLDIGADGRLNAYAPVPVLAPGQTYVLHVGRPLR
jgi:glycosidase